MPLAKQKAIPKRTGERERERDGDGETKKGVLISLNTVTRKRGKTFAYSGTNTLIVQQGTGRFYIRDTGEFNIHPKAV